MHLIYRIGVIIAFVVVAGHLFFVPTATHAEDDYAAVVRIAYPGVEIQRANTTAWIPVQMGAEMPFGIGDTLRTDHTGRAHLFFEDDIEILILPETIYGLDAFGSSVLHMHLQGRTVYRMTSDAPPVDFRLAAGETMVVKPGYHFAIQAEVDEPVLLVVSEGTVSVTTPDERVVDVPAGQGLRIGKDAEDPVPVDSPIGFSRLVAELDGCPGLIEARGRLNLNVRVGPSFVYDVVGTILNGTQVELLAVSMQGERYRIQYGGGFGWILALGVQTTCENLPTLPYNTLEHLAGVVEPTDTELQLLAPFFGVPDGDDWFYRDW